MEQVTIGANFFKKSRMDYSNWRYAWVREILQNSIDAKATNIKIEIEEEKVTPIFMCVSDDGIGMDESTIRNKLMCLGESGKDFHGTVGGFGKAKELLYFSMDEYTIHTNDLIVRGVGGQFEIEKAIVPIKGTVSTVKLSDPDSHIVNWITHVAEYVSTLEYDGKIFLNNDELIGRSYKGELIKKFDFGTLYKNMNPKYNDCVLVRIHGINMFKRQHEVKNTGLILELNDPKMLIANRDSLQHAHYWEFNNFMNELSVDKASTLMKYEPVKVYYAGNNGAYNNRDAEFNVNSLSEIKNKGKSVKIKEHKFSDHKMEYNFVFESDKQVPCSWYPENWSDTARWIERAWAVAIWKIADLCDRCPTFTTGFLISDSMQAAYSPYNVTFYINPCNSEFVTKYKRDRDSCCKLLVTAAHEYVHSIGYARHDEMFSSSFTDLMEIVMIHNREIIAAMLDAENFKFK